ncbi:MAG TPA: hypothetical protein VNO55_14255 [Polyangia bacterium]|nr:hypothetical protein [Polyangia bacterium]
MTSPRLGAALVTAVAMAALASALATTTAGCRDAGAGSHPAGDVDAAPDTIIKLPAPDAIGCVGMADGGGPCPADSCGGTLKSVAALKTGEIAESGPSQSCAAGKVCVATSPTAGGDAFYLSCVAARTGALGFGMPCSSDPSAGQRCADDSLCVPAVGTSGPSASSFCSTMCRLDSDCPGDAFCLEYRTSTLPNQSYAMVGMCTPRGKIAALAASTLCKAESECPAGQGCRVLGPRTALQICKPGGTKTVGAACASGAECRSGECLDTLFRFPGTASRAACSAVCWKNSDCGPQQRCQREPQSDNGTTQDPLDDIVLGYCRTLLVPAVADACAGDQTCLDRKTGDSCDLATGLCFTKAALIGAACQTDADCLLGATCEGGPRFPGGACLLSGCQPGVASGVDACPGATSLCAQRASDAPVFRCYERCATAADCSRSPAGYRCSLDPQPPNICLFDKGN